MNTTSATRAVAVHEPQPIAVQDGFQLPVEEIRRRKDAITSLMREVMIKGQHYGQVPGTEGVSLLKPGAEAIGMMFGLLPTFRVDPRELENGHREYSVECTLTDRASGRVVATGVGLCSTMESKYRWRWANKRCPHCAVEAIIEKRSGGAFCAKNKGGCGKGFKDGDVAIDRQHRRRVENPDIADVLNTVLKMAAKRAHVHGILMATAASDMFVQEEEAPEDLGHHEELPPPEQQQEPQRPKVDPVVGELATECAKLASKLGRERESIAELLQEAGTPAPEKAWTELTVEQLRVARNALQAEVDMMAGQVSK